MGGNGSFSRSMYDSEDERHYRTVFSIGKNIRVIELKKRGSHDSMPRTSHAANRIYVSMKKDGSGIKEIARYDKSHQKIWSIHTNEHKEGKVRWKGGHVHYWKNGKQTTRVDRLSKHPRLKRLLDKISKMGIK